jgi:hypothetical protein
MPPDPQPINSEPVIHPAHSGDEIHFVELSESQRPEIHGWSTEAATANCHPETVQSWQEIEGHKLYCVPYNAKFNKQANLAVRRRMQNVIRGFTQSCDGNEDITAIAPGQLKEDRGQFPRPHAWLLVDLSEEAKSKLLQARCIATELEAYIILPYDLKISSFAGSIEGTTHDPESPKDIADFHESVRTALRSSAVAGIFLTSHHDALDLSPEAKSPMEQIIESVRLKPVSLMGKDKQETIQWNLYIKSPTNHKTVHLEWLKTLRSLNLKTRRHSIGSFAKGWQPCTGCKSSDHYSDLCPLAIAIPSLRPNNNTTSVEAVQHPQDMLVASESKQTPNQMRGQGRGHGRGRGGPRGGNPNSRRGNKY